MDQSQKSKDQSTKYEASFNFYSTWGHCSIQFITVQFSYFLFITKTKGKLYLLYVNNGYKRYWLNGKD